LQVTVARPWTYPPGQATDIAELDRVEMLVREVIMEHVRGYIPYIVEHETTGWTHLPNGFLRIDHEITVDSIAQRDIIAGKKKSTLYEIQRRVEDQLTKRYQQPVNVHVHFKVRKNKA